jgi:hypothetical protein
MALSNTRTRAAAALVLVLFLAAVPSRAAMRGTPGTTLPPKASFKAEVVRLFHFVLGAVTEKTGTTLDSNSGSGSPPPSAPGGASPDIGSSLDPMG